MNSRPPETCDERRGELQIAEAESPTEAVLEKLEPYLIPQKRDEARVVITRFVAKSHSGPIPSAEEMEHLERILPGSANRCFEMAEREQAHRHAVSGGIVDKEFRLRGRGQWLALAGLFLLLMVVAWLGYLGDPKSAAALGAATIVGVVTIFVGGRYVEAKADAAVEDAVAPAPSRHPPQKQSNRSVASGKRRRR